MQSATLILTKDPPTVILDPRSKCVNCSKLGFEQLSVVSFEGGDVIFAEDVEEGEVRVLG